MTDFEKITVKWNLYKMATYTAGIIGTCVTCTTAANKVVAAFRDQQTRLSRLEVEVQKLEEWRDKVTAYYLPTKQGK